MFRCCLLEFTRESIRSESNIQKHRDRSIGTRSEMCAPRSRSIRRLLLVFHGQLVCFEKRRRPIRFSGRRLFRSSVSGRCGRRSQLDFCCPVSDDDSHRSASTCLLRRNRDELEKFIRLLITDSVVREKFSGKN